MDRKQAVTILKRKTTIPGDGYTWEQINEAIDMAITALSTLQAENDKLRVEVEQVKRERDVAQVTLAETSRLAGGVVQTHRTSSMWIRL